MALKRSYDKLEDIPEAHRSLYVEKDGKYVLDAEEGDGDTRSVLAKERKARADAEKALSDLKKALGDADPAKAREAMKMLADMEERALLGELPPAIQTKVDEIVNKRVERMQADFKTREDALSGENKTIKTRLEELTIDGAIRTAAGQGGVRPTAVEDAVLLGRTVFRLNKDGQPVPMKGDEVLYGKNGKDPMSIEDWLAERAADRAHWFEPSSGTGAQPPAGGGARNGNGSVFTLSREEAKNPAKYRAAKEQAQKAGSELVIQ